MQEQHLRQLLCGIIQWIDPPDAISKTIDCGKSESEMLDGCHALLLITTIYIAKMDCCSSFHVKHELSFSSVLGPNVIYNSKNQGDSGSGGHLHMLSTSVLHRPERPDQPECRYFISIGSCKYGSDCKYNHLMKRSSAIHLSAIVSTIATTT
ncbi:zinc finger CCCH domain-containing protein 58-like isoform X3 [Cornus florida]|uniref:zinc finger CCCH domain-containing protein 58-like isoform X3 n=1 Tax=Cornus florida TaxID=4283 RepID=UPI0028983D24|nr:zinc finger CCCH domain-containing protein 58-like isoform X3 [Cornus florida]